MKKRVILLILGIVFFVIGVISLVLNFIYNDKMIFLIIALGSTAIANFVVIFLNITIKKDNKKIK